MEELFKDISDKERQMMKFWVDMALLESNPEEGVHLLNDYRSSLQDDETIEFFDFYVSLRLGGYRD